MQQDTERLEHCKKLIDSAISARQHGRYVTYHKKLKEIAWIVDRLYPPTRRR